MISEESRARFEKEVAKYPADQRQSAVMACLAIAQQELGHVSAESELEIAAFLGMAPMACMKSRRFTTCTTSIPLASTS